MKNFVNSKKILSNEKFKKKVIKGFRYEVSKNKLKHDVEQINYLLKKKLISKKFNNTLKNYKFVYDALPKNCDPTDIFTLSKKFTNKLGPTFNNLIYYQPPDVLEKKLINDNKKVVIKNSKKKFMYIVIDDFLNKDVLEMLNNYCLTNSIWNEFDYKNGYIGSFIENGFNAPLLLQISEELRLHYPEIIKKLRTNHAVVPVIKVNDATKRVEKKIIFKNIKRNSLCFSQTPQGFTFKKIYEKHKKNMNTSVDDDSALFTEEGE